jgi:Dolichyl-phosphate-mannose-protein mannosyltransferase
VNEQPVSTQTHRNILFVGILAAFTLITRVLCHGTVYFGDGPAHVESILARSYVIQPPAYWLFNRIAGFFPEPAFGISTLNITCSVGGVVMFYFTAAMFASELNAFIAALTYSTVFYGWFSGEIHSSYATQLLFPVALFYLMLRFERDRERWLVGLAAVVYAIGSGLRPSDGFFLIPMAVYWGVTRLRRAEMAGFFAIWSVLCLGWFIPTVMTLRKEPGGLGGSGNYVHEMLTVLSVFNGITAKSLANCARYIIPIVGAMWPVLFFAIRNAHSNRSDWRVKAIALWIAPASLFFMLLFITVPMYLNFLTAALLLPAVNARRAMAVTAAWNFILFTALAPIPSRSVAVDVVDCYVLQYTCFGVKHQTGLRLPDLLNARNR